MRFLRVFCLVSLFLPAFAALASADDVAGQIEAARGAYGKGDQLHALAALQAATAQLNQQLAGLFGKLLPAAPRGWDGSLPEAPSLDAAGGGLEVTEAYSQGDSTLNVSLIIDNPAVASTLVLFQDAARNTPRPGWSRIKLGTEDVLVRFDPQTRAGELMMVIGGRALLQIEGNEIAKDEVLLDFARGWNVGAIRKLIGPGA